MKKHSLHNPRLTFEVIPENLVNETVQGAAITVRDLLARLALGDIDSAGFIQPRYGYSVNDPNKICSEEDFDNVDALDVFGYSLAEASAVRSTALKQVEQERLSHEKKDIRESEGKDTKSEVVENAETERP